MSIYSLSLNTTIVTSGQAAMDLKSGASVVPAIMEIGINLGINTASTYSLGRSGNVPTQSTPTLLQAEDPAAVACASGCATTWSVAPTVPAQFLRRVDLPAAIGAGVIWTFPRGLKLAVSTAMLIWNSATNANDCNVWWVISE